MSADTAPVAASESLTIGSRGYLVRYDGEKMQRIEKARVKTNGLARVIMQPHGKGRFIWSPLPLEAGSTIEPIVAFYRFSLGHANISPAFTLAPDVSSVLVLTSTFEKHVLYTLVSEAARDLPLTLSHHATGARLPVTVPAGRTTFVLLERLSGKVIDSTLDIKK